jgi:hypothetical protein
MDFVLSVWDGLALQVFCEPINFSMNGIVLARAVLRDFDGFVLANLLIRSSRARS